MKFSIRDLLLVTVIVAMAVGWWVDHRRQTALLQSKSFEAAYFKSLRSIMEHDGYKVITNDDGMGVYRPGEYKNWLPNSSASAPNQPKP